MRASAYLPLGTRSASLIALRPERVTGILLAVFSTGECSVRGVMIGRAGRSDEEIHHAIDSGQFHAAVGTRDYSVQPNVDTWYCPRCCERRLYE